MKQYTLFLLLIALLVVGCQNDDFEQSPTNNLDYSTRVSLLVSFAITDMGVETTPISRATESQSLATDLWYAIFNTATGELVPTEDGTMTRHIQLTDGIVPPIEEMLPTGNYQISFLAMTVGGDATAVLPVHKMDDPWLKVSADGTVPGDFLFGKTSLNAANGSTNTVSVTLQHAVALFRLNLSLAESQTNAIESLTISTTEGALFSTLSTDGTHSQTGALTNVDVITNREFYVLTQSTDRKPFKGSVMLTMRGKDGQKYVRDYDFDLKLKAAEITTFNLILDLAYDKLDVLTRSDMIGPEIRMYSDAEDTVVMQNVNRRSFEAKTPLKVVKKDEKSVYVQFYSTKGIGHTEIYARIKNRRGNYFKLYDLDTIKPMSEIVLPSKLLSQPTFTSVTPEGKIIKLPTEEITLDNLEFLCVNKTSAYWKSFGNGTSKVNFVFSIIKKSTYKWEYLDNPTPDIARKMVAMALNLAHLFSSDVLKKNLYSIKRYYIDAPDRGGPIDTTPDDMYQRIMNLKFFRLGLLNGKAEGSGATVGGDAEYAMLTLLPQEYTRQFNFPVTSYNDPKFHEFAHLLGFPDNYSAPTDKKGNNITPTWSFGWTKVCDDAIIALSKAKDLPVLTLEEVDALKN